MSSPDSIQLLVQQTLFEASKAERRIPNPPASESDKDQLLQVCQDFEEVMLNEILREAKLERSMVSEGTASQFYGEMIRENLAKSLSEGGGMGLAETLYRQLNRAQQIIPDDNNTKIQSDIIKGQE